MLPSDLKFGPELENHLIENLVSDPNNPTGYFKLANFVIGNNDFTTAVGLLKKGLTLDPKNMKGLVLLAQVYTRLQAYEKSLSILNQARILNPQHPQILFELGLIHFKQNHWEKAKIIFQALLKVDKNHSQAKYLISIISKKVQGGADPNYVRDLFDNYFLQFEDHLLNGLNYQVPNIMMGEFIIPFKKKKIFSRVLDLGCGTGLSGKPLRPYCKELWGVDISRNMLIGAKEKNIYDNLEVGEINEYLNTFPTQFDLFWASDVMVYLGELEELFLGIKRRSQKGAFFAFSTETLYSLNEKYQLLPSGRFCHSPSYILEVGEKFFSRLIKQKKAVLRTENQEKVMGDLYFFKV